MKVLGVKYKGDYMIQVSFQDGIEGVIDLSDLVDKGIFIELKDTQKFSTVYTTGYSIAWSEELEIDAANIYAEITGKHPMTAFTPTTMYASN
ncbi:MAG: DUF2442 domain-containing protein [Chitinophagaceae bacterium]|nr:DUF2442 domain-containing protein [Chitinophagaceae bacterium]